MNSRPLPYQGSALPLSYTSIIYGALPQTPPLRPAISVKPAAATFLIRRTGPHGLRYRLMATGRCPKRAEDEVRTRDPQLGRLMLYRLSYFRDNLSKISYKKSGNAAIATVSQHFRLNYILWGEMDSNHRRRAPADLQSAPFGHSGISPVFQFFEPIDGFEPPTCCLQNSCSTD